MNEAKTNALLKKLTPVEAAGRKAYRLMESVRSEAGELERVVARLYRCGEGALNERGLARGRRQFKWEAARACLERRGELSKENDYEENPLDDQEKLDAIRRAVFGSAPNTKQ